MPTQPDPVSTSSDCHVFFHEVCIDYQASNLCFLCIARKCTHNPSAPCRCSFCSGVRGPERGSTPGQRVDPGLRLTNAVCKAAQGRIAECGRAMRR